MATLSLNPSYHPQRKAFSHSQNTHQTPKNMPLMSTPSSQASYFYPNLARQSIQLITHTKSDKFHDNQSILMLVPEAKNKLLKWVGDSQKEVKFCCIVGAAKSGKSFLANAIVGVADQNVGQIANFKPTDGIFFKDEKRQWQLNNPQAEPVANHSKQEWPTAFPMSDGISPCTQGLVISPLPSNLKPANDNSVWFLIEVQGLGGWQGCQQRQYKLMMIALLLANTVIYNGVNTIDEQTLSGLSVMVEVSKCLAQLDVSSTSLLWIVRDFSLKMVDKQGKPLTSNEYLQFALQEQKGTTNVAQQKNKIRAILKDLFKVRACQTMVVPCENTPFSFGSVRPEFVKNTHQVIESLSSLMVKSSKTIAGFPITMGNFLSTLESVLTLINASNTSLPAPSHLFTSLQVVAVREEVARMEEKIKAMIENKQKQTKTPNKMSINLNEAKQMIDSFCCNIAEKYPKELSQPIIDRFNSKMNDLLAIAHLSACFKVDQLEQLFVKITKTPEAQLMYLRRKVVLLESQKQAQISNPLGEFALNRASTSTNNYPKHGSRLSMNLDRQTLTNKPSSTELIKSINCRHLDSQNQAICQNPSTNPNKSLYQPYFYLPSVQLYICKTLIKEDSRQQIYTQFVVQVEIGAEGVRTQTKEPKNIVSTPTKDYHQIRSLRSPSLFSSSINMKSSITVPQTPPSSKNNISWTITRKYKDFLELSNILSIMFPRIRLHLPCLQISAATNRSQIEEVRKGLEGFMGRVASEDQIRNSRIFQKFIKVNKEWVGRV